MKLQDIHNVFFIGIGGIGMSALAQYFLQIGKQVQGYDKNRTPITEGLQEMGIPVCFKDDIELIAIDFKNREKTLVVYTPAVPMAHSQLQYFLNNDFAVKKRSEVLGIVTQHSFCFAVAGTHGKTTTSCILAHLLNESGVELTAFLGGVSEDFNSNFVFKGTDFTVVEADEFDRSFLQLQPNIACITSMDADHLDIYNSHEELKKSFMEFADCLKPNGKLIVRQGLSIEGITYGIEDEADYCVENHTLINGTYTFDIHSPKGKLTNVQFTKPGEHNLLNALAAFAMAAEADVPLDKLASALGTFKGVQRRFSYQVKEQDFVYIDDYAHHPTEIKAVYQAINAAHPNRSVTVIFQPHLFSRTKDFAEEFAESLSQFDQIMLLEIYPAREKPIEGINSTWLLEKIENKNKKLIDKKELINEIMQNRTEVLVTLGAGDIGLEVPKIKKALAYAS